MGCVFFFQAEDGIRDGRVTGVQTCALPILRGRAVCTGTTAPAGGTGNRARSVRDPSVAISGGDAAAPGGRAAPPWPVAQPTRRGDRHREDRSFGIRLPAPGAEGHCWDTPLRSPPEGDPAAEPGRLP